MARVSLKKATLEEICQELARRYKNGAVAVDRRSSDEEPRLNLAVFGDDMTVIALCHLLSQTVINKIPEVNNG